MAGAPDAEPWLAGLVEIARVGRPHGVAGELSVQLYGDEADNLLAAEFVVLDSWPGTIRYRVLECAPVGPDDSARIRLKLAGIDSRERAQAWTGARLFLEESALAELPPGEFYLRDLIGLRCITEDGLDLGRVREIWPVRDCDRLLVDGPRGELFIPATDEVLREIDRQEGRLVVALPDGFLDGAGRLDPESAD